MTEKIDYTDTWDPKPYRRMSAYGLVAHAQAHFDIGLPMENGQEWLAAKVAYMEYQKYERSMGRELAPRAIKRMNDLDDPKVIEEYKNGGSTMSNTTGTTKKTAKKVTVAARTKELLLEGKLTDDQIFAKIQKQFPDTEDNKRWYVGWYRNDMRRKGIKVPDRVLSAADKKKAEKKAAPKKTVSKKVAKAKAVNKAVSKAVTAKTTPKKTTKKAGPGKSTKKVVQKNA